MAFRRPFTPQAHHANRRRREYSLTKQRYMLPLLLLAALGAVGAHLLIMRAAPWLYAVWESNFAPATPPERVADEEVTRVVVRKEIEELPEAVEPEMPEEPAEIEDVMHEPVEIDVLDVDVPELVMAPGETNIPMPEPEPEQQAEAQIDMMPRTLDPTTLGADSLDQANLLPEPTPLNANTVIANAAPQTKVLEDAEGLIDSELKRRAREGEKGLPSDTRSLADLMNVRSLGANSGVARLGTDLLFGFNQSQLKNSARISMLQLAALIHKNPDTRFIIEGHTDGIGGEDYNALLSLHRAAAVCEWLVKNGVPVKHVYMRACGSSRALVDLKAPRDKQALNRRVEIHMRKQSEALPPDCLPATYAVDRKTPIQTQLKNGVRIPHAGR